MVDYLGPVRGRRGAGYLVGKHFKHPIIGIGAGLLGLLWLDLRRGS